jgi:hypothetical protein
LERSLGSALSAGCNAPRLLNENSRKYCLGWPHLHGGLAIGVADC